MCAAHPHIALPAPVAAERLPDIDGNDGIAITGRDEAYSTALWLQGPSAFWLHPEGPLSDTTPEQWQARRSRAVAERLASGARF